MTTSNEETLDDVSVVESLRAALSREASQKMSERRGRVKAERELRDVKLKLMALEHNSNGDVGRVDVERQEVGVDSKANDTSNDTSRDPSTSTTQDDDHLETNDGYHELFPLSPIGLFQSSFSCRNGTPRQPRLVPLARGRLTLKKHVQPASLEGLEQYSHVWIVYVFHKNTDLGQAMGPLTNNGNAGNRTTLRAKVRVPRLNGERRGVLATRSPHRPNPVGLSLCRIRSVDLKAGILEVEGADLVDGTPVLDVKPYLPFCEAFGDATAPDWVNETSTEPTGEPLQIASVEFVQGAEEVIKQVWNRRGGVKKSLYESGDEFLEFCTQALARDIRSFHQRKREEIEKDDDGTGKWEVVLDGISVRYDVFEGRVFIKGGGMAKRLSY